MASPELLEVKVRAIDGTVLGLELPADLRTGDLKELVAEQLDVLAERQRLIFRGRAVRDSDPVGQHVTGAANTFHMVPRPSPRPRPQQAQQAQPQQFEGLPLEVSQLLGSVLGLRPEREAGREAGREAEREAGPAPLEAALARPVSAPVSTDLPWRDLRRLNQHVSRVLGRTGPPRSLPPSRMPAGEAAAFLGALHGATSQLAVAVSDFQVAVADDAVQPRQQLQFATALVAAAQTFRGVATALQSGVGRDRPGDSLGRGPSGDARPTGPARAGAERLTSHWSSATAGPPPPMHLARAYLCALLRDVARAGASQSGSEHPSLTRLTRAFSLQRAGPEEALPGVE